MPCFDTITISSQDEIQSHLSALCPDGVVLEIHIVNATGELNFTTITEVNNIYVIDNPLLELLAFPELQALSNIFINPASSLGVLWLPKLKAKLPLGVTSDDHDSSLVQEWAPAIKTTGALPHGLYGLFADNLVAIRTLVVQSSPFGIFGHHLPNLTGIDYLETDACLMLDNLTEVYELLLTRVHGDYSCVHELPSIKSIGALNVTGPASIRAGPQGFAVNDSLIVGPSPPWYYDHADTNSQGEVTFFMGDVKTVGSDTKIIGNADLPLDFGGLESIGGNLILSNNQNCTVDFGQLSVVTNLSMVDNVDTVLPALLKLENAMNIHLRGYIDTSTGSNIFPNLVLVRDTVTIEAWNDDFNCSKLVSQRNDRTINKLICNGTDNGTYGGSNSSSSSTTLTKGAWAGIAVGIVIVVSVLVGVAVWSVLGFRRLLKALATRDEHRTSKLPDGGDHEQRVSPGVDGGNNSESREMDGRGVVREKPDDYIARPHEMPVPPAELACTSRSSEAE